MIKKLMIAAISALFVIQAGPALADVTPARVFTVNKTAGNVFMVVTVDEDSSYEEVSYIPSNPAGHVIAEPHAWFRKPTAHHFTAQLFYEGVDGAFCTVKFVVENTFSTKPEGTGVTVKSSDGACTAAGFIEEAKRNTACQVVIKPADAAAAAK
jgi:hypothetical protein